MYEVGLKEANWYCFLDYKIELKYYSEVRDWSITSAMAAHVSIYDQFRKIGIFYLLFLMSEQAHRSVNFCTLVVLKFLSFSLSLSFSSLPWPFLPCTIYVSFLKSIFLPFYFARFREEKNKMFRSRKFFRRSECTFVTRALKRCRRYKWQTNLSKVWLTLSRAVSSRCSFPIFDLRSGPFWFVTKLYWQVL
jgi:hypothetical protein